MVKFPQGSTYASHVSSFEVKRQQFKSAISDGVIKTFSPRYVYSTRCNPSDVEMLLKKVKNKSHFISRSRVYHEQSLPVKKSECTDITAKVHVNRGVDSRSYAQVVRECGPESVIHSSNMSSQGIGVNRDSSVTHQGKQWRQQSVKPFDLTVSSEGVTQQTKHSHQTSPVCKEISRAGGIVVTNDEASYTAPCVSDTLTHTDVFKSDSTLRSPASCANSLGQIQATATVCDLPEPVTAMAKGQDTAAPVYNEVVQSEQYHKPLVGGFHSGTSECCKVFDVNGLDEKYINSILMRTPKKNLWQNSNHAVVKAWKAQTDFQFGFIPLSDVKESECKDINVLQNYCPIKAHKLVASHKKPNYLGARIKVDSQLNLQEWYDQLYDYWDQQLLEFLTFGFPLDFHRNSPLSWEGDNHKSALEYPQDIDAYLKEEIHFNAIVGPFDKHPCHNGHISPFMTRDKPGSENRRVIIDLSWPVGSSVNSGIDKDSYMGTEFALVLPTVDHITDQLKLLGKGAHLYKIDISRAFRHIKVDPLDYDLLGLHWRYVYVDTCVLFRSRHGSQIFQRVSDAVRHIMRRHGHKVINYVDDYVGFGVPSDARRSFDLLYDLLQKLGLTVSQKKLVAPATSVICLGVEINTISGTIAIPADKLRQISDTVKDWTHRKTCSRRQLQSLLGHLLYIHKCVKPARYFLNRMLQTLRSNYGHTTIKLDPEFHRDLRWFERFLPLYNGVSLYDHKKCDHQVHLIACLQGLGGVWQNLVYHLPITYGYKGLNIAHLEMVNILVALKVFCRHWAGKHVMVHCDNQAVVCVLQSGKARDPFLGACARNVWLWAATFDIDFTYVHVMGKYNRAADLLSRWSNSINDNNELQMLVPGASWVQVTLEAADIDAEI